MNNQLNYELFETSSVRKIIQDVSINGEESDTEIFDKMFKYFCSSKGLLLRVSSFKPCEKSKEVANSLRAHGNIAFKKGCLIHALIIYHKSLSVAPHDSVEYGLAIANRSAVLFALNKFKDCLTDIYRLFKAEYPENLKYKIFIRESKCFMELKIYTKARTAIKQAEKFVKANKINNMKSISAINLEIQTIITKLNGISESDALPTPEEHFPLPELKNGENPNYTYASKDVTIKFEQKCVIADADINKGDVLFVEKPCAVITDIFIRHPRVYCHYCFKCTFAFIPCTLCTYTYFCSDKCRQTCWDSFHKWVCRGVRERLLVPEMIFALRILLCASHEGLKAVIDKKPECGNKNDKYPFIYNLPVQELPVDDLKRNALHAAATVQYLVYYTAYFEWLHFKLQRPATDLSDLQSIIGSFILRHINQISSGEAIFDAHIVGPPTKMSNLNLSAQYIGFGLYVSSVLIEVGFFANAVISYHGNVKVVKATKFIKKGTPIMTLGSTDLSLSYCFAQFDLPVQRDFLERQCLITSKIANLDEHIQRFQIWLCEKCSGKALSVPFTERGLPIFNPEEAKCTDCKYIFSLNEYKKIEKRIKEFMSSVELSDKGNLEFAYSKLKKIYHKDNLHFCPIYTFFVIYYRKKGAFLKSMEYMKLLIELYKKLGDSHELYISVLYHLIVSLINYCITLRSSDSSTFKKYYDEAKKNINIISTLLHYNFNERTVHYLTNILNDYLESSNFEDINKILQRHIL